MNPKEARQERIDQYLLGQSPPAERTAFEQLLEQDPELRQQLADTETAMAAVEIFEDDFLKDRLRDLDQQFQGGEDAPVTINESPEEATTAPAREAKVVNMRPLKRNRRTLLVYAASLLLLLGAAYWILQPGDSLSARQLAINTFEPYDNIVNKPTRGEGDETAEATAYLAYDAGDFKKAVYALQRLEQTPVNQFYLAQSLFAEQDFRAAEELFVVLSNTENPFQAESRYYWALTEATLENVPDAKQLLRNFLLDFPDNDLAPQAKELLEDLP